MQGQQNIGILPNQQQAPSDTMAQINQQNYQRRQYEEAQKRQQQERQDMWLKEAYGQLDFKHFATGTVLDPVISSSLEEAKKAIARRIMDNPDITSASVMYDVANVAGDVNQYATKAKNVRAATEAAVKEYAKNPSVDGSTLLKGALSKAFMKYDENTHSFVPKDPSEIDDQQDYVTPTLGSAINSDDAFYERVNKAPMNPYKNRVTDDRGGVKTWDMYEGKYSPVFHDLTNRKGEVVDGQNTPATGLKVKSQPVKIGDKVFQGVTDDVYRYFASDPVTNAIVEKQAKGIVAANPSLNMEDVKRVVLHDNLSNYTRGYINKVDHGVDDSQKQSQEFRATLKTVGEAIKASKTGETGWNNAFNEIKTITANNNRVENGKGAPVSHLSPTTTGVLIDLANKLWPNPDNKVGLANIYVKQDKNGQVWLHNTDTDEPVPLNPLDVNLNSKVNPGAKQKAKAISNAQTGQTQQPTNTFKFVNGKKKF